MRIRIACVWCVVLLVWGGAVVGQQVCIDMSDKCTAFSCQDGTCAGTPIVTCNNPDACTVSSCNPQTGACENTARNCDDGNPCTDDSCVLPTGCVHTPHGGTCETGNACTTGACVGGFCLPTAKTNGTTCGTSSPCLTFACQSGFCLPTQTISCPDDGDKCTIEFCNPTTGTPVCDKITITTCFGDACHADQVCNSQTGCVSITPTPLPGNPCDDGNPCTQNDTCASDGVCNGQPITSTTGTPTSTASQTPTATATPTVTPTLTQTPVTPATATVTSTATITATATNSPVNTATSTATNTTGPSATPTTTATSTSTQTATGTPINTVTSTATATLTRTNTTGPSATPTATRTGTATQTATAIAPTATLTATMAPSGTTTRTPTITTTPTSTPTAVPKLDVQPPAPHDFGNEREGDQGKFTYTVQNVGGGTLVGTAATPCNGFSVMPANFNLPPAGQQPLMVTFSPPGTGSFSCQLMITSNGGDQQIGLTAQGLPPAQIPAVASPTSPAGLAMIGLLATGIVGLLWRRAR